MKPYYFAVFFLALAATVAETEGLAAVLRNVRRGVFGAITGRSHPSQEQRPLVESVAFASPRSPSREPPESAPASASDRGVAFAATFDFDPDIYRREMRDLVWERSKQRRFAA